MHPIEVCICVVAQFMRVLHGSGDETGEGGMPHRKKWKTSQRRFWPEYSLTKYSKLRLRRKQLRNLKAVDHVPTGTGNGGYFGLGGPQARSVEPRAIFSIPSQRGSGRGISMDPPPLSDGSKA